MDFGLSPHCPLTNSKATQPLAVQRLHGSPACLFVILLYSPSFFLFCLSLLLPHFLLTFSNFLSNFLSVTKINSAAVPHSPDADCQILSSSKSKGQSALSIEKKKTKIVVCMLTSLQHAGSCLFREHYAT